MITIYWISVIYSLISTIRASYDKEVYEKLEEASGVFDPLWILIIISFIPVLNSYLLLADIKDFFQAIYETIKEYVKR